MEKGRAERFALSVEKYVPDAITSAVFMVVILFIFASLIGIPVSKTIDAYSKGDSYPWEWEIKWAIFAPPSGT